MEPIRILQVCTSMGRGGLETMLMNYYRHIDRTKVQFDFLLHRQYQSEYDTEILHLGGKIFRMPEIKPGNYFKYKKALSEFFKENHHYKIVHSHINALSFIVLSVAKKHKINVRIAHSHIAIEPFILKNLFKKNTDKVATIKESAQTVLRYLVPIYANHYFACGRKAGKWLYGNRNSEKIVVLANAIDVNAFKFNSTISRNVKEKLNISGKKVIGHVGRLNEQKNHLFLLKIFKELIKKDDNLVLVLVGDGNLKDKIKKEIRLLELQDKVLMLGIRKDIPELLQAFDLFLFPSLYEGLPVTMIEAQASGLKVVASDTITREVNLTELVININLNESPQKWADKILDELEYERTDVSEDIIAGGYDITFNAKKLEDFYLKEFKLCVA